jgi:BirA family biotin operon repressor/biotin-[acetyl-CoA-carboxylase] ligase
MDVDFIQKALRDSPVPAIQYEPTVGSTMDEMQTWFNTGARPYSLVFTDAQTAGRGRDGRVWHTPRGTALALTILLPPRAAANTLGRFTAVGALALCDALQIFGLSAQVKWPNDVLLDGKKVAGVLADGQWQGNQMQGVFLGIGVNVRAPAVPPTEPMMFPATAVDLSAGREISREALMIALVKRIVYWTEKMHTDGFLQAWERALAFREKTIYLLQDGHPSAGTILGLTQEGHLRVKMADGQVRVFLAGEVRLRETLPS